MNYNDFLKRLEAVQTMLGGIEIPADIQHVGIMSQIHMLLQNMKDECNSCLHNEQQAIAETK